jgi:hypothetical protein
MIDRHRVGSFSAAQLIDSLEEYGVFPHREDV